MPLVENGESIEKALINIMDSIGEQNEQMSLRVSELERVRRSEKRLKKRTDEHFAKNLSRMAREAEQRELWLGDDTEKLRVQQKQILGTLDTKIDLSMEGRTQAIMDRLDGLLGNTSGSKNGDKNSGEPSRQPRVSFNEQPNRRKIYGSTRGRGSSPIYATGNNRPRGPNLRGSSTGSRATSNEPPTHDTNATGRSDSMNWNQVNQGRSHPSDSNRRENPQPLSGGNDA